MEREARFAGEIAEFRADGRGSGGSSRSAIMISNSVGNFSNEAILYRS